MLRSPHVAGGDCSAGVSHPATLSGCYSVTPMTQPQHNSRAPLPALAARKRQAAERRDAEAAVLRAQADELDQEHERREEAAR